MIENIKMNVARWFYWESRRHIIVKKFNEKWYIDNVNDVVLEFIFIITVEKSLLTVIIIIMMCNSLFILSTNDINLNGTNVYLIAAQVSFR